MCLILTMNLYIEALKKDDCHTFIVTLLFSILSMCGLLFFLRTNIKKLLLTSYYIMPHTWAYE